MKHSNKIMLKLTGVFIVMMTVLAGCGKNDNSNTSAATPQLNPNWGNCSGCSGILGQPIPGLIGVRSQTASGDALFAFDLIVNQDGRIDWNDPKAFLYYAGPATLQGAIRITQPGGLSFCGAPPGDYEVRPMSPSMISVGGIVSGGSFEALGPTRIIFRVGPSTVYNPQDPWGVNRNSATNRIGFNLFVDFVNGFPCGPLSTN